MKGKIVKEEQAVAADIIKCYIQSQDLNCALSSLVMLPAVYEYLSDKSKKEKENFRDHVSCEFANAQ